MYEIFTRERYGLIIPFPTHLTQPTVLIAVRKSEQPLDFVSVIPYVVFTHIVLLIFKFSICPLMFISLKLQTLVDNLILSHAYLHFHEDQKRYDFIPERVFRFKENLRGAKTMGDGRKNSGCYEPNFGALIIHLTEDSRLLLRVSESSLHL